MSQETKREITIAAILATFICLMAFAICRLSLTFVQDTFLAGTAATLEQGGKKAEPLIRALDEYMKQVGTSPERLNQLVPLYLSVVPKPAPQYEFIYQRSDDGQRFSLSS